MEFENIKIGGWYWFFSGWHGYVVIGQVKDKITNGKEEFKITFHKVVNTDGSSARWSSNDETNVVTDDVIRNVDR